MLCFPAWKARIGNKEREKNMITKRAVLTHPGHFEFEEKNLEPEEGEILVKVKVCGLCNWELNHFKGILGDYPLTLGHEWAGTVVKKGKDVTQFEVGDKVAVLPDTLEGFSEYAIAKAENCFLVNKEIPLESVLLEPIKCIVTVLRATSPEVGDFGVVVGCGPMGLWCTQILKSKMLAGLIAVDVDDGKLELAKRFGAIYTINSTKEDVEQRIREITNGHMADFVIEGTGIADMLEQSAHYLRVGQGRLVLMSYYDRKAKEVDFRLFSDLSLKLLNPHPAYSQNPLEDARRAMELINRRAICQTGIITHKFRLNEIQKAFEELERKPKGYVKGIVVMDD